MVSDTDFCQGISVNAVKTQVRIAVSVSVYVLAAIIKKRLYLPRSLYTALPIPGLSMFERMPLIQVVTDTQNFSVDLDAINPLNLYE